ncbi:MAG: YibE/F family protein, partial [Bacilli bacterium]|nr:YibE/F family protein [Bacilli bacterium]
ITTSCGILISLFFFLYGANIEYNVYKEYQDLHNLPLDIEYTKAKVIETVDKWVTYKTDENGQSTDVLFESGYIYYCKILDGEFKDEYKYIVHRTEGISIHVTTEISEGSTIYIRKVNDINPFIQNYQQCKYKDDISYSFSSSIYTIDRSSTLIALVLIFVILLLLFSRVKGFHTLLALVLAIASIIIVYIPAVLSGKNIYLWTIIICLYSTIETLVLLEGFTKKSLTAMIGCIAGILVSGIICVIANNSMNIIGQSDELDSAQTWISQTYYHIFGETKTIDLRGIVFSTVLFGALGAIMDVSMSLASSLLEVYNNSTNHSLSSTMKSGFNIGRDMLGTMSNTLVLAYLSTSLALILYYVSHYYPEAIFKSEMFALSLSQSLIGCIGILITIPLTSLICGLLYNKKEEWFLKKIN